MTSLLLSQHAVGLRVIRRRRSSDACTADASRSATPQLQEGREVKGEGGGERRKERKNNEGLLIALRFSPASAPFLLSCCPLAFSSLSLRRSHFEKALERKPAAAGGRESERERGGARGRKRGERESSSATTIVTISLSFLRSSFTSSIPLPLVRSAAADVCACACVCVRVCV